MSETSFQVTRVNRNITTRLQRAKKNEIPTQIFKIKWSLSVNLESLNVENVTKEMLTKTFNVKTWHFNFKDTSLQN